MFSPFALHLKDFYKTGHVFQYPKGTEVVYSNITARGSRIKEIDKVVVFGIQYCILEYLINQFNETFFSLPTEVVVNQYKRRMDTSLGPNAISIDHIKALHKLGYLPIEIKAIPEGMKVPIRVPFMTIKNTIPEFFWVTNMLETLISAVTWGAVNSATIADRYRQIYDAYAKKTSDIPEFVDWMGHDFSMRGMFGIEAFCISGAAHLLSFTGTDTIPAIDFLEEYYGADCEKELIGGSVSAFEHSTTTISIVMLAEKLINGETIDGFNLENT